MTSLRKIAKNQPCYLRLPGCAHDPEQTVLAHIRRGHTAGGGMKPADINGVPACARCHDVYDGRAKSSYSRAELDAEMLRAHVSWLDLLVKKGVVTW